MCSAPRLGSVESATWGRVVESQKPWVAATLLSQQKDSASSFLEKADEVFVRLKGLERG